MDIKRLLFGRIESGVIIGAALIVAFFTLSTNGMWLSSIPSVLRVTAAVGILAIGQAMLMSAGEIDLSVGSVFAFTGVVFIWGMDLLGLGILVAMVLAVLAGCLIGFVNGYITVRFRVSSMIVTLGALFVYRGFTYISTQGFSLSVPREYRRDLVVSFLKSRVGDINITVIILALVMLLFTFILAKTRFGSHVLAVGGDADAALANGISPAFVKIRTFIVCSGLAGFAAVLVTCQEGAVYSTSGVKMELETIAAAVIGGCSLRGGLGSIWGPVLGVFVLSSLKGGLMMMGAPTSWYIALVGAILIAFLMFSCILNARLGISA